MASDIAKAFADRSHCDGDWEHQHGVRIESLDNPGWSLDVDLGETPHAGRSLGPEMIERSQEDWIFVEVSGDRFRARCGPGNLNEMLERFADFIANPS